VTRPPAPVPILTGPTGSGKSTWAERLGEEWPVEIVSVDSALVYRGMDIGTAKPSAALRARIPHHLIDILDPAQAYSAGQFVTDAQAAIAAIRERGRIPLLVGGTMLYLRALREGLAALPVASREVRRDIDARAARQGWPALHAELARLDPEAAARIHPNDPQRIQRALEVCTVSGRPLSELQRTAQRGGGERFVSWGLAPERATLHAALEARLARMMGQGFLEEVTKLHARGDLTPMHPAVRAVGYRQLWAHLDGRCDLADATARALAATRQLAKRQFTWMRAQPDLRRIEPADPQAYVRWKCELRRELAGASQAPGGSW